MMAGNTRPWPVEILGLARQSYRIFRGESPIPLGAALEGRLAADPEDAAAWLDLGILHELTFQKDEGLACQTQALELERVFRIPPGKWGSGLRLLMFVAPGDIMSNVPLQFLLMDSDVTLDLVFLGPSKPLPESLPDHDLALMGVGESDVNRPFLDQLETFLAGWPCPVLLQPAQIRLLARDSLWQLLESVPGILVPPTTRTDRSRLEALAKGAADIRDLLPGGDFPLLVRPIESHGGHGLERLKTRPDLSAYLDNQPGDAFYLSTFVNYRGPDGFFRKYRIALLDGKPFICHMAVAEHWMLHYLNAGMDQDQTKRAEEAQAFATFDSGFAVRHSAALEALYLRTGLEYFAIDCAETRDGKLLIFEADTAMVIHDMDPPALYPYKAPQMQRLFSAFRELLERHAAR